MRHLVVVQAVTRVRGSWGSMGYVRVWGCGGVGYWYCVSTRNEIAPMRYTRAGVRVLLLYRHVSWWGDWVDHMSKQMRMQTHTYHTVNSSYFRNKNHLVRTLAAYDTHTLHYKINDMTAPFCTLAFYHTCLY